MTLTAFDWVSDGRHLVKQDGDAGAKWFGLYAHDPSVGVPTVADPFRREKDDDVFTHSEGALACGTEPAGADVEHIEVQARVALSACRIIEPAPVHVHAQAFPRVYAAVSTRRGFSQRSGFAYEHECSCPA